jgi:hypothetical protein
MSAGERDVTEDWKLPHPVPTIAVLEARIDEALVIARAAESAAISIGDAAIESATQARRAAELAAEAAAVAANSGPPGTVATIGDDVPLVEPVSQVEIGRQEPLSSGGAARPAGPPGPDQRLAEFMLRADQLGRRLAALGNSEQTPPS